MAGIRRPRARIIHGAMEPIFDALPETVLDNLRRPASENALLWNLVYPLARPGLSLSELTRVPPLWGTAVQEADDDELRPYFWGYALSGERLPHLDEAASIVDGKGISTEVDLFLVGARNLILVEAKHLAGFGRCGRFARGRCPEIHTEHIVRTGPCRYWKGGPGCFAALLDFGERPLPGGDRPPCGTHYQLARTLTLGYWLAQRAGRRLHLWAILPRHRWRTIQPSWLDFVGRIRDEDLWRDCRALAWEDVRDLATRRA
jgi:hypothetical protein